MRKLPKHWSIFLPSLFFFKTTVIVVSQIFSNRLEMSHERPVITLAALTQEPLLKLMSLSWEDAEAWNHFRTKDWNSLWKHGKSIRLDGTLACEILSKRCVNAPLFSPCFLSFHPLVFVFVSLVELLLVSPAGIFSLPCSSVHELSLQFTSSLFYKLNKAAGFLF